MKTIKLTVRVSGYLKKGDHDSFESTEETISVECEDMQDDYAINFMGGTYNSTAWAAVKAYRNLVEDYKVSE